MNDAKASVSKRPGNKSARVLFGLLGVAFLLVLLVLAPWKNARETRPPLDFSGPVLPLPAAPSSGYVGSTACRDCHEDIHDTFRRHPMGNSITHVGRASPIEDYLEENTFASGGFQYRASTIPTDDIEPDAGYHHEELLRDTDGELVFQQEVNLDFTVGSGARGRSYLFQRGSLLFQSPLTWYVKKGIWGLAPGYRPADHLRFERRVDDDCLSCHAGHVNSLASLADQYDPVEPFHELSIGCERCHGPGRKHVEMHLDGPVGEESHIVNPSNLDPRKRESVCNQCHLAGHWRQPRFGKSFLDFRPGQDLAEAWTVQVSGTGFDEQGEVKFTSHVEQMHSSRCFQASEGRMGCISCHDPHRKPDPQQAEAFYQSRCLNCHEKDGCSEDESTRMAKDNSCVHCHMGKTNVNNIAHSSATDHRILKNPSRSLLETKPLPNPPWEFFDKADQRLPSWERERAEGISLYVQAMKSNNPQYLEQAREKLLATTRAASNDVIALQYLGNIYLMENDYDSAAKCLAAILKLEPTHELGLQMMASVQYQKNNLEAANQYYRQVIDLNPWASDRYGPYAKSLAQAGDIEGAINALEFSLDNNPTNYRLHLYLATLLDISGRNEEAMEHRRFAARLEALVRPEPADEMSVPATTAP